MRRPDWRQVLLPAAEQALRFLEGLHTRPVAPRAGAGELLASIDRPVPEEPCDAGAVVADLVERADPGLCAMPSGRFFGWVIGGGLPAALAADWLAAAWDQNAGSHEGTPSAAAFEQVALRWTLELLGLPPTCSGALVTGAQMANTVCLAAARHAMLAAAGWDVEARGLPGAPALHVIVGEERHDTVPRSLRLLGLGADTAHVVAADGNGRMRADLLAKLLDRLDGPAIVCAQAGNVNTGAIDPMGEIARVVERRRDGSARSGASQAGPPATHGQVGEVDQVEKPGVAQGRGRPTWLHVDGAFGLWARASRTLRPLADGVERADSWSTDAHKWPNVPYDSGIALVAHPGPHRRAMSIHAAYLPVSGESGPRNPFDWTPELSRRARGFALYAALAQLGRGGMEALVDRSCAHARRFRDRLAAVDGTSILNEVELNQVLVRFDPGPAARAPDASGVGEREAAADAHTREVVRRVQADGTCFVSGTTWRGLAAMRISVSNWSTDDDDVDRSVGAIVRAHLAAP